MIGEYKLVFIKENQHKSGQKVDCEIDALNEFLSNLAIPTLRIAKFAVDKELKLLQRLFKLKKLQEYILSLLMQKKVRNPLMSIMFL